MTKKETSASAPASGTENGEELVEVERELKDCEQRGDVVGMADAYNTLGQLEPDIEKAMGYFREELDILEKHGADRYAISWVYECVARKYEEEGDFNMALSQLQTVIELFERDHSRVAWKVYRGKGRESEMVVDNKPHIAYIQYEMARVYGKMGDIQTAIELYSRAMEVHESEYSFVRSELSKSELYSLMGALEMQRGYYANALVYFEQAVREEDSNDNRKKLILAKQMLNWSEKYSKIGGE